MPAHPRATLLRTVTLVPEPVPAVRDLGRALGGAGPVMLIGGAEDKVRDKLILSRFAAFAGGPGATSS